MEVREGLKYLKTHQWMKEEPDGRVLVGITDYAQAELRALVFVTLPVVGDKITAGEPFGEVESVKVVSEVYAPVSGVVEEVNEELLDEPGRINEAPYEAWLIKVKDISETGELLSTEEYRNLLDTLQHD